MTLTDVLTSATPFQVLGVTVSPPGTCSPTSSGPTTSFTTVCNLGTEPAGGRPTIHVVVGSDNEAQINDVATVESTTEDPDSSNNQATGQVRFIGSADLSLDKTGPASVTAGTQLSYLINVSNAGPSTAKAVEVHDQLPLGVSFVSVTPSQGTCTHGQPNERDVQCAFGNLAAGATATMTVVGLVASGVPPGTILFNEAVVTSATGDPDSSDVRDSVPTTVVASAHLALTFTSDVPTTKPSSTIHYKVTVDNIGPSDASGVVVTIQLPPLKSGYYAATTAAARCRT